MASSLDPVVVGNGYSVLNQSFNINFQKAKRIQTE